MTEPSIVPARPAILSAITARRINWQSIDDSTLGLRHKSMAESTQISRTDIDRVFGAGQAAFSAGLRELRNLVKLLYVLVGTSVLVAAAGLIIATTFKSIYAGAALSTVGIGALLALFMQIVQIGKDQVLLELVPIKYRMTIELAQTPEQYDTILNRFLDETSSMRSRG